MACDTVRASLSAAADGDDVVVDRAHVAGCASCLAFEDGIRSLRTALRFEAADEIPDVAPRVLAEIARRPARRWSPLGVAASLLAGVLLGAAVAAVDTDDPAVATALPAEVTSAQADLHAFAADVTVVEHHPARTRTGTLRYVAPERLSLRLDDVSLEVGGDGWRLQTPSSVEAVRGREPFSAVTPTPLDLVLPASGFLIGEHSPRLPERRIGGRPATGTRVTAAQVAELLDALRPAAEGRPVHPADTVELWLDAEHLTPLELVVTAAGGPDRARWAAARRLADPVGEPVLEVRFSNVVVNDVTGADLPPFDLDGAVDAGFRSGEAPAAPTPRWLPTGMAPHRAGSVGPVDVRTWTDGRAWVKVRATATWRGDGLFGGLGSLVRPVRTAAGPAYVDDRGSAVAVHADGLDLVVTGSVPAGVLLRIAGSLPVTAVAAPDHWDVAATAGGGDHLPLRLPASIGLAAPAVRVAGDTITAAYAGDGDRSLLLTVRPGDVLPPPLEPDVVGVALRGVAARWSPDRAELEWVEDGRRWALRSRTIGLAELVALAERLEP